MKKTFIFLILSMVFLSVGLSQCDEGFIWIDDPPLNEYNWDGYNCFYESDLNVLSDFIQVNPSLTGEHLDIGWQVWSDGRLESLTLYALQMTSVPDNIGDLSSLNYLNLHFNQITNIPETIGELVQLTELFLENNRIETLPESIGNLSNLVTLNINENQLISIPESIGTLGSLEELLLFNNELTFLPESICNIFPNLSYYDFSANYICPPYPDCIENVGFQFTDDCPNCDDSEVELWDECYSIENTTSLNLYANGLTGVIPPEIGNLVNLEGLYLASNQLSGEIPSEIGNLVNLNDLYLSYNQLSGEIPSEIGNLVNLIDFYLSSNQLSGEIPESICNIYPNLSYFQVTHNQLCPPYPSCIEDYVGYQDTSNCEQVSIIDEILPISYNLYNAYPNPFNPVTTLRYNLPKDVLVNITIYDMLGREVSTLVSNQQTAGYKSVQWNATNNIGQPVSAGLYLYTIQAGKFRQTKKMVLLK
jgi:Leucine-rich repeat (LRR) protein